MTIPRYRTDFFVLLTYMASIKTIGALSSKPQGNSACDYAGRCCHPPARSFFA
jgi:hypothetical protein